MNSDPRSIFVKHLDCIQDPRHHNKRHLLSDMLVISLCAIVSISDSWTQVAEYGRSKIEWFRDFLELSNGIPYHDTFGRTSIFLAEKTFQNQTIDGLCWGRLLVTWMNFCDSFFTEKGFLIQGRTTFQNNS